MRFLCNYKYPIGGFWNQNEILDYRMENVTESAKKRV